MILSVDTCSCWLNKLVKRYPTGHAKDQNKYCPSNCFLQKGSGCIGMAGGSVSLDAVDSAGMGSCLGRPVRKQVFFMGVWCG